VLRKRESYRELFFNWDIEKIARLTDKELEDILKNPSIIRNRLKIFSVRKNALVVRKIQEECGSFSKYLWKYVNNTPEIHYGEKIYDFPTSNTISDNISKDLKKLGMSFVGTTIIYAFIQAV
jgi:DNA-3-methyladenine glycosylase I